MSAADIAMEVLAPSGDLVVKCGGFAFMIYHPSNSPHDVYSFEDVPARLEELKATAAPKKVME